MDNFEELLLVKIREMPALYIGKKSVERLRAFVDGYSTCFGEIYGKEPTILTGFNQYVAQKYKINTDHDWSSIIQFFSNTEESAFDMFYQLLDEFLEEREKG